MAALKAFLFHILRKYRIDPDHFSGCVSFEFEITDGDIRLVQHSMVPKAATRH